MYQARPAVQNAAMSTGMAPMTMKPHMIWSGTPNSWENAQMAAAIADPSMVNAISVDPTADIRQPTMPMLCDPPLGTVWGVIIS